VTSIPDPPVARQDPTIRDVHGDRVVDEYFWLRNRDDPEVIAYLDAENAHTQAVTAHTEELQEKLFQEIKGRVQETDQSAPVRRGDNWYYGRTVEGLQYTIYCRRQGELDAEEAVLLDENVLAEGSDYFALGAFDVSPDQSLLAYSVDTSGAEIYRMRFRDLATGADLPDEIPRTYYGTAWSSDSRTLFYTVPDEAMRPWQVWRHTVGTASDDDVLVYQEDDHRFFVGVGRTRSERFVLVSAGSKMTDEVLFLDAADPSGELRVIAPREQGIEYGVDHHGDRFLITTNAGEAPNFRLVEAPLDRPGREQWREVIPHRGEVRLYGVDAFADHLVVYEREGAVRQLRVTDPSCRDSYRIEQAEEVSTATPGPNPEFESAKLRYRYTSLVTPTSDIDYDVVTHDRDVVKQQPVLGGYDPDRFETARAWATAPDGGRIPISLVHRKGLRRDGSNPALLYGYGSYEISIDPSFSHARLSLLERGFVFAIAHIRGGGELGRSWYEGGKLLYKTNTFTDFVACAEHLVAEGWTSPRRLAIRGGSAGGLLMGVVANMRPDLFGAVVAEVPFVDALNTILDPTLPLTVTEWEEWGNPVESADAYEYMKAYSPYENVEAKEYPPMLVTAGLNDPRVSYWEPAKWVARLRATKTDGNRLLLKCEMGAGHSGPSGRYDAWKDEAFVYAFLLDTLGVEA